jgi:hypothetical protein
LGLFGIDPPWAVSVPPEVRSVKCEVGGLGHRIVLLDTYCDKKNIKKKSGALQSTQEGAEKQADALWHSLQTAATAESRTLIW